MPTDVAPQVGVCPEYQLLLERCQSALILWQQRRSSAERSYFVRAAAIEELNRLRENYAQAYARLESHEQSCRTCQYISKIAGLDFESMANALNRDRRIA
jgi:hypothetical protein